MQARSNPPLIAVVPTYNMAQSLKTLIVQLIREGYEQIFILDDASTDNTEEIIRSFTGKVRYTRFRKNVGSAANRNRIIDVLRRLKMPDETVINFIDADVVFEPSQQKAAKVVYSLALKYPKAGIIVVTVLNKDGTRGVFNYGPAYSHRWLVSAFFLLRVESLVKKDGIKARKFWDKHKRWLNGYCSPFDKPEPRITGGVVECFTITRLGIFESVGGYDPKLRYLEASDFSRRLKAYNLESVYDPSLTVRHTQTDVRGWRRQKDVLISQLRITLRYAFK